MDGLGRGTLGIESLDFYSIWPPGTNKGPIC